jgi:hypothetical protein
MSNDGGSGGGKGRTVGGRYRLVERIGAGGMGTVWRAVDELVEREVAVKQPRLPGDPESEGHQRAAHRLYREARAAARVDHPSAVSIHDVVVEGEDGLPWIVMELVRGESLHEVLQRGPLEPAESARIGLAVLGALRAAHSVGIVHRDVKPANVLLGPHGRVVLTDFGIAHIQGEESLTVSGEFVGSLEFIAPERMSGRGAAGPASDLWSLGVLLYAAVEGWSPFRRTTLESTLAAILAADTPEPKQAGPLGPLVVRLLEKDPERRPGAAEVAAVLEAVAEAVAEGEVEGWPVPGSSGEGEQDASGLRELAEDAGTMGLGMVVRPPDPTPEPPAPEPLIAIPVPTPAPAPEPATTPKPNRRRLLRAAVAPLGILLAGGAWLGASFADGTSGRESGQEGGWVAHRERGMNAVLHLPSQYRLLYATGEAGDATVMTVYSDNRTISVQFTEWAKSPASPLTQAKETAVGLEGHERTAGQYTSTSFHDQEAVQSDVTYDPHGKPIRVMQLIVRTDGDRMYRLQVSMPKGTPDEKKGTAVFKAARDRLEIGNG